MRTTDGRWTRREWLKAAGGAALAGMCAPPWADAAEVDLRARAKKNLKLAIFTGVYAGLTAEAAARRIAEDGFKGVVLEYQFADLRFNPWAPDWDVVKKVRGYFDRAGLAIVGLYGYYNVVAPDPDTRRRGEERMRLLIENWRRLGSPIISTETGTFDRTSEWNDSPENQTEKGFQECRAAFAKLAQWAEQGQAVISIEPYWKNVIGSPERTERLFREVDSPALRLVMDPCNYFRKADLPRMKPMLEDIFRRVGGRTVLAHAKDLKGAANADDTDLPAAGLGVLDYPLYLRLLAGLDRELYLAVEHLKIDDVARSRDFVLAQMDRI